MIPVILEAAISPAQVIAGGAYMVTVFVTDAYLSVADVNQMTIAEVEKTPLSKMREGGE